MLIPSTLGQIFWTAELAPSKYARSLSYFVGWLTSAGYFFWTAGTFLIASQLIWALVQVCHPAFTTLPWHFYVGYLGAALFALLVNLPLFKWYPVILKGLVVYINAGALFVMISLLVRVHPKQSAKYVFVDIVNSTGWSSDGVVFFLGLLPGLTAINAFDSASHMSDELPTPERQVPQVMFLSAVTSALGGIPMVIVYMFCVTNQENLLSPAGGQPIIQLFVDSLDSLPLTIIASLIFITVLGFGGVTMMTTFSRVWWSFAREGGVPFSAYHSGINKHWLLPVNAITTAFMACALIGLLVLGSSTALNDILGCAILCIFVSYTIPLLCSLLRKRENFRSRHYFNLGSTFGPILNVVSIVWMCFVSVWLCFPLYIPVVANTMNYSIVVFVGMCLLGGINWGFSARKRFTIPTSMP